jgi:hypothetical protein
MSSCVFAICIWKIIIRICAGHHYTQTNTNNVNKSWPLLHTTRGKDEPNIVISNWVRSTYFWNKIHNECYSQEIWKPNNNLSNTYCKYTTGHYDVKCYALICMRDKKMTTVYIALNVYNPEQYHVYNLNYSLESNRKTTSAGSEIHPLKKTILLIIYKLNYGHTD